MAKKTAQATVMTQSSGLANKLCCSRCAKELRGGACRVDVAMSLTLHLRAFYGDLLINGIHHKGNA